MDIVFYISAFVAVVATALVITQLNAVHALLYLIVSLFAVALIFFTLGAPFVTALEIIIYAGAIMVLFVFVMMLLNLGQQATRQESHWLNARMWIGPALLSIILIAELVYAFLFQGGTALAARVVDPTQVGMALFGPYLLGVELASMVLLAGLVGAYHLGQREKVIATEPVQATREEPQQIEEKPVPSVPAPGPHEVESDRVHVH